MREGRNRTLSPDHGMLPVTWGALYTRLNRPYQPDNRILLPRAPSTYPFSPQLTLLRPPLACSAGLLGGAVRGPWYVGLLDRGADAGKAHRCPTVRGNARIFCSLYGRRSLIVFFFLFFIFQNFLFVIYQISVYQFATVLMLQLQIFHFLLFFTSNHLFLVLDTFASRIHVVVIMIKIKFSDKFIVRKRKLVSKSNQKFLKKFNIISNDFAFCDVQTRFVDVVKIFHLKSNSTSKFLSRQSFFFRNLDVEKLVNDAIIDANKQELFALKRKNDVDATKNQIQKKMQLKRNRAIALIFHEFSSSINDDTFSLMSNAYSSSLIVFQSFFFHNSYAIVVIAKFRTFFVDFNEQAVQIVLFIIFSIIDRKHFENIRIDKFKIKNMLKLNENFVSTSNKIIFVDETIQAIKFKKHFFRCLIIYFQIVFFIATSTMRYDLSMTQSTYMRNLLTMMNQKIFAFVILYHEKFVIRIIFMNQNNFKFWMKLYERARWKLTNLSSSMFARRKRQIINSQKTRLSSFDSQFRMTTLFRRFFDKNFNDSYIRFNDDCVIFQSIENCFKSNCKFIHVCFMCQQFDHDETTCFTHRRLWFVSKKKNSSWITRLFLFSWHENISFFLIWISKDFSYDIAFIDEEKLNIDDSLIHDDWKTTLRFHLDRIFVRILLRIIRFDAKIDYENFSQCIIFNNHSSIEKISEILIADIQRQLTLNRLLIVKSQLKAKSYICSSLKLMSKNDDDWKRIHDRLSHFSNSSINHYIRKKYEVLEYIVVNEIIIAIILRDRHVQMFKKNFVDAFRHISLIIFVRWMFDFYWLKIYYLKLFLLFELRIAFFLFDLFNRTFNYILIKLFRCLIIYYYLDDFFFVFSFDTDTKSYKKMWVLTCEEFDFRTNAKKKQSNIVMSFLSIKLNFDLMKIKLFANKFERVKKLVHDVNNDFFNSISHQKFDELIDFLFFCARMIVFERIFLISFYRILDFKSREIHINVDMRVDLIWWIEFLSQ